MVVAFEKAAENKAVNALRLRIGGEARVEICGAGFDEEGEGRRIIGCWARATREEEKKR